MLHTRTRGLGVSVGWRAINWPFPPPQRQSDEYSMELGDSHGSTFDCTLFQRSYITAGSPYAAQAR